MKAKPLHKGIDQLMDEGVAQLFTLNLNGRKVIGTVGALQFEVIQYRLLHEYSAQCTFENLNVHKACWIREPENPSPEFDEFKRVKQKFLLETNTTNSSFGRLCLFLQMTQQKYPELEIFFTSEF